MSDVCKFKFIVIKFHFYSLLKKDFVKNLQPEQKDFLLIRVLSQGRGSLDFARNTLTANEGVGVNEPMETDASWCICGVCRPMPTEEENVCCKKTTCVTSYTMFNTTCIDREVLLLAIRARCDIRADEPDYSTNSFRKAAYRQYTLWKYGKLGKGNRRIIPACVVIMVRKAYPAADGIYMGFRWS